MNRYEFARGSLDLLVQEDEHTKIVDDIKKIIAEAEYYNRLKEENRLAILPCGIGDTVYLIKDKCDACERCDFGTANGIADAMTCIEFCKESGIEYDDCPSLQYEIKQEICEAVLCDSITPAIENAGAWKAGGFETFYSDIEKGIYADHEHAERKMKEENKIAIMLDKT